MTIMAIDPGKRKSGIFIIGNKCVWYDLIDNRKLKTEKEIFNNTNDKLNFLIEVFAVDVVIIEDYAYSLRASRQLYGAEIKGMLKNIIYKCDKKIKIIKISIGTWKSYMRKDIFKIRNQKKRWIGPYKKAVKNNYGWDFKTEDICDAYFMIKAIMSIRKGVIKSGAAQNIYNELQGV
ncbi:hypothetical protein LCGC14_1031900 [marine sediment metagenome]|uniref:Holliday junction resolvase RuvC n=1 Tax=marine sediment metagenome TaxID=412755 RepID=A0A0F9MUC9_9ZZZZ